MVFRKIPAGYILRFDQGEELVRGLTNFCQEQDVKSGWISGLGGALWAELAFYHPEQKAYEFDRIDETLEVASLTGNIALVNEKPFLHVHAVVADMNYHSYAGHLKELAVGATCEVKIDIIEDPINRSHNETAGLKTFDL